MHKRSLLIDGRVFKIDANRGTAANLRKIIDAANENFDGTVELYTGLIKKYDSPWGRIFYVVEEQLLLPLIILIKFHTFLLSPLHTTPLILLGCKRILILHDLMFMDNIRKYGIYGDMFLSSLYRTICIFFALKFYNNKILTISNTSQRVISDKFLIRLSDITIISCHFEFSEHGGSSSQVNTSKYMLTVTGKADHKNFQLLKEVYDKYILPFELKVVGNVPEINDNPNITFYSDLTSLELMKLYENAEGLIFPSLQEGFGIPLLEAANFDIPIFCSDIPIFREIMGDKAYYFDPLSTDDLFQTLSQFALSDHPKPDYTILKYKYSTAASYKKMVEFFCDELI